MGASMTGMAAGIAGLLLVLLVVAAFVIWFGSRRPTPGHDPAASRDEAVALLRRRLADGDIDDDEYLTRRSALGSEPDSTPEGPASRRHA